MAKPPKVFLDANILIGAGKPPGGPELRRVVQLVESDLISVITTDLTRTEVAKKHAENDFDVVQDIIRPHFRAQVEEVTGVQLPEITRQQLRTNLMERYEASVSAMLGELQASVLSIDDVQPSVVFDAYATKQGFFAEGKKDQFPDAFAFEALKGQSNAKQPVIIVSADGDFTAPVANEPHISLVNSLPALFVELGYTMDEPDLDGFLDEHNDQLRALINDELLNWGLSGDVEDAEVYETEVSDVEVVDYTAFRPVEAGESLLMVGRVKATAMATYTHPDWDGASYDSEDKVFIPHRDVSGEVEVELLINVSVSISTDDQGEPEEIEAVAFRSDDFVHIELHPPEDYR